jgi:EmrB/QacA subfamily drug resistance transporter
MTGHTVRKRSVIKDMTAENETPAVGRRRWLALTVVLVAAFMDLLDVTVVNVAVPSILRDLDAGYAQVQWVVTGYVLGFAAVLITGGRLGDIYGRRRIFLVGMAGFTLASLLCGAAADPAMLIGARFVQGAMAGLMVPQILAIIHVTFPPSERGKVFGLYGAIAGMASVAGLVLGGALVEWNPAGLEWRPIFLVNVPVGLVTLLVGSSVISESKSPVAPRLDLVGAVLAVAGVLMLVYPLTEGRSLGWPAWSYLLMGGGVVVLAGFVLYERRRRTSPLVVLGLFRRRAFSAGLLVMVIFWIALGGFFLVWTLYLQAGLGWSPLHAGLTAVAFAVGAGAGAGLSVQVFVPRFGRRTLMGGALVNAAGFAGYAAAAAHYGPDVRSWQMIVPLFAAGAGFGLVVAPMLDLVLTGVPVEDAGSASGVLNTTQQIGMAFGVALVGVVFFGQLEHDSGHGVDQVAPAVRQQLSVSGVPASEQDHILAGFRACVRDRSAATDPTVNPPSCRGDDRLANVLGRAGIEANAHNFSRTFAFTLWYAAGVLALVFLGLFALPKRVQTRDPDAALSAVEKEPAPVG